MHEWSLAQSIISTLLDLLSSGRCRRISRVVVQVGKLVQIDREILLTALRELSQDTPLRGTSFEIQEVDTKFRCNSCGYTWTWEDVVKSIEENIQDAELRRACLESMHLVPTTVFAFTRCPRCGSPDFEAIEGMDIKISWSEE